MRVLNNQSLIPPNTEFLELNFVGETATGKGNNTQFIMENLHDGTFQIQDGRVGITIGRHKPKIYTMPIEKWDEIYAMKVKRGYLLTKKIKMDKKVYQQNGTIVNGQSFAVIQDESVKNIVTTILQYAQAVMDTQYSVKVDDISDEMIAYGQLVLEELALKFNTMSVAEFNNKLKVLYAAIPRRIDNLSKVLAQRKIQFNDIIANEQDLFDVMVAQVKNQQISNKYNHTILDAYHLEWRCINDAEKQNILSMLGPEVSKRFSGAWRIENLNTRKAFDSFCQQENLSKEHGITELFHGSRNENFWSIITNGLTVNPTGVVITGKMFGNGTYFAPLARKSLGYTSSRGAYYTGGTSNKGYLAIYEVATGKTYDVTTSESDLNYLRLQERCPGAHCTWAHAGVSLCNDEVIVYQNQQSTIKYLVEINA